MKPVSTAQLPLSVSTSIVFVWPPVWGPPRRPGRRVRRAPARPQRRVPKRPRRRPRCGFARRPGSCSRPALGARQNRLGEPFGETSLATLADAVEGGSQRQVEDPLRPVEPEVGVPGHQAPAVERSARSAASRNRDEVGLGAEDDAPRRIGLDGLVWERDGSPEEADLDLIARADRAGLARDEASRLDARVPLGDRTQVGEVAPDLVWGRGGL